jgi:hypothetical protein
VATRDATGTLNSVAHVADSVPIEPQPKAHHPDVARVLAGEMRYDDLSSSELQAAVRCTWSAGFAETLVGVDFESDFRAKGWTWSTLDEDGNVVTRTD